MSTNKTPMQQLKYYFDDLKKATNEKFLSFQLNNTKKHDHVLIFRDKKNPDSPSFGFSFNYKNISPENWFVTVSYKEYSETPLNFYKSLYKSYDSNKSIVEKTININEFKNLIKSFNTLIKNDKDKSIFNVIEKFNKHFFNKEISLKSELKNEENTIKNFIENKTKKLKINEIKKNEALDNLNNQLRNMKSSLTRTKAYKEFIEAKKILEEKEKKFHLLEKQYLKKYDIDNLKLILKKEEKLYKKESDSFEKEKDKIVNKSKFSKYINLK